MINVVLIELANNGIITYYLLITYIQRGKNNGHLLMVS